MRLRIGFIGLMIALIGLTGSFRSFKQVQAAPSNANAPQIQQASIPHGAVRIKEQENNNTPATANPILASSAIVRGNIWNGEVDFYSIQLQAGQRVSAATMTSASAGSTDSLLSLYAPNGTSLIETDDDDGTFGSLGSVISSAPVTATATYYLRVSGFNTAQIRYYDLYVRILSEPATAEIESNNTIALAQLLPTSGSIAGVLSSTTDVDIFKFNLNAGDTIYTSLDLNPERDSTNWDGRVGIALFNNFILYANDTSTTSPPNAEAHFMTVKESGTYYIFVSTLASSIPAAATYLLDVSVFAAEQQANCQTYTSNDVAKTIPTTTSLITSSLTIPDSFFIADLDVSIQLTHTAMIDLDVQLQGPDGNVVGLFSDIGATTQTTMNLALDDDAAIPIGSFTVVAGMHYSPESTYRLDWFDGGRSAGTWTLLIHDDFAGNGGVLQNWSIRACAAPPANCPDGTTLTTITSNDFEANDGGFTHSGINDSWEYGTPSAAPLIGSYSGVNSWKTNLDGPYLASSVANLLSPAINIPNLAGPVYLQWHQRYQLENASFDHYTAAIGTGIITKTLYEFDAATMTNQVGSANTTYQASTVWSRQLHDISEFKGQSVRTLYHLDTNSTIQLAGVAIDDFQILGCVGLPTATPTEVPTATNTPIVSETPTNTVMPTETETPSITPTETNTPTNSPTPSITPTGSVSVTPTPSNTPTNTPTITVSPTNTSTPTITVSPTNTPSVTPSATTGPTLIPVYLPWVSKEA
ncbi:pre-peptidase C-terminal domain-containing protein [Herpetosiphon llansteffanensis]|uniref:pre-peptidase C-terminal domain-containing protein n=1 Tax=Herpetosiphon llansteffanensis TaxID=2094568 RepID=UPI000D7CF1DB|nr:pre-peptidase C-terminal domain-containing protein [Herpetosiphon llansteffanensis]